MASKDINMSIDNVISALNTKADTNLANSARATEIASIAESAASAANSANVVAQAASELINTSLPTKVNKFGDTINGNLIVDGNMTVTGEINATITGSSESAMSATKDSNGNVIVDTYATKNDIVGIVRSVNNVNADAEGRISTMPDYSAGIAVNSSFTAPSDGYIIVKQAAATSEAMSSLGVNGVELAIENSAEIQMCIPVSKGDVFTTSVTFCHAVFFPIKV